MKEILSQNEIDLLIQRAAGSQKEDIEKLKADSREARIKLYDFRRPKKFTHSQAKALNIIFTDFARYSSMVITEWLRKYSAIELMSIEEQSYFEYTNTLLDTSLIGVVDFAPLQGSVMLEISNSICNAMIDIILGGDTVSNSRKGKYTEIELMLLRKVMAKFLLPLKNSWADYIDLNPSIMAIETNGQQVQIAVPNDIVSIITMKIRVGTIDGIINLCLPSIVLEPIISKLDSKAKFSKAKESQTESNEELLKDRLKTFYVEIKCELGKSYLTIDEINMLQQGDVIKINKKIGDPVDIMINNVSKFKGDVGTLNNRYAVQIIGEI